MLASRTVTASVDLPRTSVFLHSLELASTTEKRSCLPSPLPVVVVLGGLLDTVDVLARSDAEDEEVVRLDETLQISHQAPGVLTVPLLSERNFEFSRRWDALRKSCCAALDALIGMYVLPDLTDPLEVASWFRPA